MAVSSNRNPCRGGPCFTGPLDHRFCSGFCIINGLYFKCPCHCNHHMPPKDAWPGVRMHRIMSGGQVVDARTFKPCP